MNLTQIVSNASISFSLGFAFGYSRLPISKRIPNETEIEIAQAVLTQSHEVYKEAKEFLDATKRVYIKMNVYAPYIISFAYSNIVPTVTGGNMLENILVSLPSTYLGTFFGRKARKYKDRSLRQDIETLKKIANDPKNPLQYIPEQERIEIETGFRELEQAILQGEDIAKLVSDEKGPNGRIYHAITGSKKIYVPALLEWSLHEHKNIAERATVQKEITSFFEQPTPNSHPVIGGMLFGKPKTSNFRMYEIDGQKVYAFSVDIDHLTLIQRDNVPLEEIRNIAKITKEREDPWNRDYKALSRRIIDENKQNAYMLLKSTQKTPEIVKRITATQLYLNAVKSEETEK